MKKYLTLAALVLTLQGQLFACAIIVTNDSDNPIALTDIDGSLAMVLRPGETKQFGSADKRGYFYYMPPLTHDAYSAKYVVRQIACSQTHRIDISVSDIENDTLGSLFTRTLFESKRNTDRSVNH